jgi:hypothetical protein
MHDLPAAMNGSGNGTQMHDAMAGTEPLAEDQEVMQNDSSVTTTGALEGSKTKQMHVQQDKVAAAADSKRLHETVRQLKVCAMPYCTIRPNGVDVYMYAKGVGTCGFFLD